MKEEKCITGEECGNSTIKDLVEFLENKLGYCPKCGYGYGVLAVFKDKDSNELSGFKVICGCNTHGDTITQDEVTALKIYTVEELAAAIEAKEHEIN